MLVIGSGGREHALTRALGRSPEAEVMAAPGNVGMARDGVECLPVTVDDLDGIVAVASSEHVDLVVVGPEAPLVDGLVDKLGEARLRAFGPSAAAARIEGSKAYAKEVMAAAGVPTAAYAVARAREEAEREIRSFGFPVVLKADGLAAGKGVFVCTSEDDARGALDAVFAESRFGRTKLLIEEFQEGAELSLLALCDGLRALPLTSARDYKRIQDGDRGPNTGGMGSYSPVAEVEASVERLAAAIHQPVVDELRSRGTPFHGVLYAGLMLTADGPKVLEFNCRFGDPETQAILPRLESDLVELLEAAVRADGLADAELRWSSEAAVTVVLASRGYPKSASHGDLIRGLDEAAATGAEVLHAGTCERDADVVTHGGRVLNVTGLGPTLAEARQNAYRAADMIHFDGLQLRRDIAAFPAEPETAASRARRGSGEAASTTKAGIDRATPSPAEQETPACQAHGSGHTESTTKGGSNGR